MRSLAAGAWLAISVVLTLPAFFWHVTQFSKPGAAFLYLLAAGLACLCGAAFLYHAWRRRGPSRFDPWLLAAAPLSILLVYRPLATLAAGLIVIAAWLLGAEVLARLRFDCRDAPSVIALPPLTGLAIFTLLLFAAGSVDWLTAPLWIALALLPWLFAKRLPELRRAVSQLTTDWRTDPGLHHPLISIAAVFAAGLAALTAVIAALPTTAFDAVAAHLPLARSYLASHSLHPPQALQYGWYPQGFEILAGFAWFFGGQTGAQVLAACVFALAVLLLLAIASRCGLSRTEAAIAAFLAASIPLVHWTGSVPKNDLLMSAWQLAALYCLLRWRDQHSLRWLVLSAAMLGLAFQVKHVALLGAVPIGLLWIYAIWNGPRRIRAAVSVFAVFLVFGSFSLLRTWRATGNPVYPESAVHGVQPGGRRTTAQRLARWVALPVSVQFDGGRHFESSSRSPLGAGLFVFLPFALLFRRRNWQFKACGFFAVAYLLYWSLIIPTVLRYAIPALMVLCIPISAGLVQLVLSAPRWLSRTAIAAFGYCLCFGWLVAVMIGSYPAEVAWLTGKADDSAYLRATIEPFGAVEFLARNAPGDDVFGIDACTGLYAANPDRLYGFCGARRSYALGLAPGKLREHPDFRWVIVPNLGGPELIRDLGKVRPLQHVYGDRWYSVYSVGPRP